MSYDLQLTVLEGFANSLLEKSVMSMCLSVSNCERTMRMCAVKFYFANQTPFGSVLSQEHRHVDKNGRRGRAALGVTFRGWLIVKER